MKSYELIPHTADIRLKVKAKTQKELFVSACEGMSQILKKDFFRKASRCPLNLKVSVSSVDQTTLLIDFLSEILTLSQEHHAIFGKVYFLKFSQTSLLAKICGAKVDQFDNDIKAVTYHQAEVKKNPKGEWETTVIFDI